MFGGPPREVAGCGSSGRLQTRREIRLEEEARGRLTSEEDSLAIQHFGPVSAANIRTVRRLFWSRKAARRVKYLDEVPLTFGRVGLAGREMRVDEAEGRVLQDEAKQN